MVLKRLVILLSGCVLMASGAWADDVGYVDCNPHPDETQVFAKASKTPDVVATVPCGERFTVLIYGFVFSRVQTRDGKIGYVYSNLITVDRSGTAVLQPASARTPVPRSNPAVTTAVAQPSPAAATPPQAEAAQVPAAPAAAAQVTTAQVTPSQVTPAASAAATAATSSAPVTSEVVLHSSATPAQSQPASDQMAPAAPMAPVAEPAPNVREAAAASARPRPAEVLRPQPAPAEAVAPAARDTSVRTSWERPNPGARRRAPLLELFGGYAFARFDSGGGTTSNLNGAIGSFGWNIKPWLQIAADSSYNFVTISGTKSVLYGNHFGARYFHRGRNRWGLTPFAEGLVGGSRLDTSLVGVPGYNTSNNCMSFKVGGGLDLHPSRHFEIRLFDVDYYRTAFGTNVHQTNYWATTGIVLRLFGGGSD